jgi:hypothetical protein
MRCFISALQSKSSDRDSLGRLSERLLKHLESATRLLEHLETAVWLPYATLAHRRTTLLSRRRAVHVQLALQCSAADKGTSAADAHNK